MVYGPGNVTLASPSNTYQGSTRIQSGTLTVGHPLALQNTVIDMNASDAGTLSFGSQTTATLGGLIGTRNINLGNANVTIGAWHYLHRLLLAAVYSGAMSGAGGITIANIGVVTLGGANTYTGGTSSVPGPSTWAALPTTPG